MGKLRKGRMTVYEQDRKCYLLTPLDPHTENRLELSQDRIEKNKQDRKGYLQTVLDPLHHGMARFFLIGLFRNVFQINLQISLVGVSSTIKHAEIDWQLFFSVGVSLLSIAMGVPTMFHTMKTVLGGLYWYYQTVPTAHADLCENFKCKTTIEIGCFIGGIVLYIAMVIWSVIKLCSLYICWGHLMNIGY